MTRDEIRSRLDGRQALISTLYGECVGEPVVGQLACASVIRNRVLRPSWWGRDYKTVCLAPHQFSCWWELNSNTERVYSIAEALVTHSSAGQSSAIHRLGWITDGVMSEAAPDETFGANHYLTATLLAAAPPKWAMGHLPVARIGRHVFFRLSP